MDVDAGLIYFKLFQSAQLVDAYKEACRIVVSFVLSSNDFKLLFINFIRKSCVKFMLHLGSRTVIGPSFIC